MANVETNNGKAGTTQLATTGKLVMLQSSSAPGLTCFNQGEYGPGVRNGLLPRSAPDGKARTIQSSGCGMCAITSYLVAAGCRVPTYDDTTQKFSMRPDAPSIDPGTLNRYLQDYALSLTPPPNPPANPPAPAGPPKPRQPDSRIINAIYAPDGEGALRQSSQELQEAILALVLLSHPEVANQVVPLAYEFETLKPAAVGTASSSINETIDVGSPVLAGVRFEGSDHTNHQVLIVGYAEFGANTYYMINDSGFTPMDPYQNSRTWRSPVQRSQVLRHCIGGSGRDKKCISIDWARRMTGLERFLNLSAWSPPSA